MDLMTGFYPNQSKEFIGKRIEANKDFHSFYRSFVPLFYQAIKDDREISKTFEELSKFRTAMGADVHVENFGFVMNSVGSVRLVLNDVDDVTQGPIFMDVLRHYISGKIVTDDLHWDNYFKAYKAGLKGDEHQFSEYTQNSKKNSQHEVKKFLDEYIASEPPYKFIKYKRPMYVIDEVRKSEILESLRKSFSKIKIYDQYLRIKEDGGSAGLLRYEVLAELAPGEDPIWLDIKAMTTSSYDKVFTVSPPGNAYRMGLIKKNIYTEEMSSHISMIKIAEQDFSVRYMNQFALGVKIEDISTLEIADVVLDEAYALGLMHARNLDSVESYGNTWEKIPADELKKSAKKIREMLERKYTSKI
jgi:hypothetical protein